MPVTNIITVLYSLKSCRTLYSLLINTQSFLFVCRLSSAVNPALDFTKKDIVKPFQSWSYYKIMKGWPRSLIKILSLGIKRNTN